jgi:HAD superfamily hydrolase (TIGR01490 family)
MKPTRLALFDLDHTLIPLDSDYQWADYLARTGRAGDPEIARARNNELMRLYNEGQLTAEEAAEFMLGLLAAHTPHDLAHWHEDFMRAIIRPGLTPQAFELVNQHLQANELCAVVTATNSFVTAPIARAFGIHHLIATDPQFLNGRYTGKIQGTPSFRQGKVKRVDAWLSSMGLNIRDFQSTHFYSDSINDLPLLEYVTHPVATNPSPALHAIALERNWPVLQLFDQNLDQKS